MKKSIIIALVAVALCGTAAVAQNKFEKSKKLTESEVPVVVMQSFAKDFANLEKGVWKVYFSETKSLVQGRSTFTPERYEFTRKGKWRKDPIELFPDGRIGK